MIRVWFRYGKIGSIQTVRTLKLLLQIIHRVIPVTTGFEKANSWLGLRNNLPCHVALVFRFQTSTRDTRVRLSYPMP